MTTAQKDVTQELQQAGYSGTWLLVVNFASPVSAVAEASPPNNVDSWRAGKHYVDLVCSEDSKTYLVAYSAELKETTKAYDLTWLKSASISFEEPNFKIGDLSFVVTKLYNKYFLPDDLMSLISSILWNVRMPKETYEREYVQIFEFISWVKKAVDFKPEDWPRVFSTLPVSDGGMSMLSDPHYFELIFTFGSPSTPSVHRAYNQAFGSAVLEQIKVIDGYLRTLASMGKHTQGPSQTLSTPLMLDVKPQAEAALIWWGKRRDDIAQVLTQYNGKAYYDVVEAVIHPGILESGNKYMWEELLADAAGVYNDIQTTFKSALEWGG